MDRNAEEANEYRRKYELSVRENKHLQEEITGLIRDKQVRLVFLKYLLFKSFFEFITLSHLLFIETSA